MNRIASGELFGKAVTGAVGDELRRVREQRGLSRARLVEMLPSGIGERTLLAYEHGLRQITVTRFSEICWVLGVEATPVYARGLQRAQLLVDSIPLTVDVHALLADWKGMSRELAKWARNMLTYHPDGIVEIEPVAVRHLAISVGRTPEEIAQHLALFIPDRKETTLTS